MAQGGQQSHGPTVLTVESSGYKVVKEGVPRQGDDLVKDQQYYTKVIVHCS